METLFQNPDWQTLWEEMRLTEPGIAIDQINRVRGRMVNRSTRFENQLSLSLKMNKYKLS